VIFTPFPKLPRLARDIVITEKLDGTNASVHIRPADGNFFEYGVDTQVGIEDVMHYLRAGSRTRWISIEDDNYGFARWVYDHAHELRLLGVGHHFGEWWGKGIQRNYSQPTRRFSLFNTGRWVDTRHDLADPEKTAAPECCSVVPVLYSGPFGQAPIERSLRELASYGSAASPGFMDPEGVVIFHCASQQSFKKTIKDDESPKGKLK
jgi:hypothetical protein